MPEVDSAAPQVIPRDRSMHAGGDGGGGSRLLTDEAPVADELRVQRIAEIEDLRDAVRSPGGKRRDGGREAGAVRYEVRDPCRAFPEALVRVPQVADHGRLQLGIR